MANNNPEQQLINSFVHALKTQSDLGIKIQNLINTNCRDKVRADIEFISDIDELWAIEAKSHRSSDRYNTVHKIFGELLKETGRKSEERVGRKCNYAILLPEDGKDFYSYYFQLIGREKFVAFGELIPVECVFTFGDSGISRIGWEELYDYHCPEEQKEQVSTEEETDASEGKDDDKIALEIIQKIQNRAKKIQDDPRVSSCIFRGEARSCWEDTQGDENEKVSSGLYRMLEKNLQEESARESTGSDSEPMPEDMRSFEKIFVKKATRHVGENIPAIAVLSELQHYGGKTNLIDFTKDLNVALFFACSESTTEDGRVILLPLEPNKIQQDIAYPQGDNSITLNEVPSLKTSFDIYSPQSDSITKDPIYSETGYILVDPTSKNPRPIFQSSIFVHPLKGYLDKSLIEENSISIAFSKKKSIRQYLEKYHNISWDTIYNDIHGYIQNQENDQIMQLFFGLNAYMRNDYKKAIIHYTNIIELFPRNADVYAYRSMAYINDNNQTEANKDFDQSIKLNPQNADTYRIIQAHAHAKKMDFKKSVEVLNNAIVLSPRNDNIYLNRGIIHSQDNNHTEAIKDFTKTIEINPQNVDAYTYRSISHTHDNNYIAAIQDFSKAIDLNPQNTNNYISRGIIYSQNNNQTEAIKDFSKAIDLNPRSVDSYFNRGIAYSRDNNHTEAIKDFNKAIDLNPQISDAYACRGIAYFLDNNQIESIKNFDKAIELNSQNAISYFFRSQLHLKKGNCKESMADAERAKKLYQEEGNNRGIRMADDLIPKIKRRLF